MIVFWAADPETTSGSYGAQEGTVRRQWLKDPKLGIKVVHVDPYYNAIGAVPARQVVRAEADHVAGDGDGDRLRLDQGRPLRQGIRRDPHASASTSGRPISLGEEDGIAEDAGVAGEGDRRSGQGRARARARVGQEARLSRARRLGQRPRRRLPQPDRHPVGARDGVPRRRCRGSASPAATWATCNGARRSTSISISPAMPKAACRATSRTPRCRSRSTSACRSCRP